MGDYFEERNRRYQNRGLGKLFFLGSVVGLAINIFYVKTGIGLALVSLPFMGAFTAIIIAVILEGAQAILNWLNKWDE